MRAVLEGSAAIAEAVQLARPSVIAAYPITPQTHIVEALARAVAEGRLDAEVLTAESEHSAAGMVLGASAAGVRAYTATSSQGLLYMAEVVFDIAGMRLPVVMTIANRALSAPLSIWNDHQDSMTLRDAGWLQIFAQTAQEAHDLHIVAFRVAEDEAVQLPVMVCVDGFVLTHAYEPVEVLTAQHAEKLLPARVPAFALDVERPVTMGTYAEPAYYTEARRALHDAQERARSVLAQALDDLADVTGRRYDAAFDAYRADDADTILVAMGTAAQTARVAVDELRARGRRVGLIAVRTYRPFPAVDLRDALEHAERVVVLDRSLSIGAGAPVVTDVRAALLASAHAPSVVGVVAGLGGRDISVATVLAAFDATADAWIDLHADAFEVAS